MDVQVLVTHADHVAIMEREMGHPPRIIRGPDLCYLFQARDEARLPGLVDRWEASGIAAQVVQIPSMGAIIPPRTGRPCHQPTGHRADPPERSTQGATHTRRDAMRSTTDHAHEGHDQTAPPLTTAREPEGTMDAPPETEASCEAIER
jgi:hypothetical protein